MEEDEVGGTCSMYERERRQKILVGNSDRNNHLLDKGVHVRVILQFILKK
jgi:hypothetical protein